MKKIIAFPKRRPKTFWSMVAVLFLFIVIAQTGEKEEVKDLSPAEKSDVMEHNPIGQAVRVLPMMNGIRTQELGEYVVAELDSSLVTIEALTDFYFNFVAVTDYNYYIIDYTDNPRQGVYFQEDLITKNVGIIKDDYDDYSLGDWIDGVTAHWVPENGELIRVNHEEEQTPVTVVEAPTEEILALRKEINAFYEKLQGFKSTQSFHENGFSSLGQSRWHQGLQKLREETPVKSDYFYENLAMGTLDQLGRDYMRSKGEITQEIAEREKEYKAYISGKNPE